MLITVVNEAQDTVSNQDVLGVLRAITSQVSHEFEPYWNLSARLRLATNHRPVVDPPTTEEVFLDELGIDRQGRPTGAAMQLDPIVGGALIFLQSWERRRHQYRTLGYCYGFHGMYGALPLPVGYVFITEEDGRPRENWSLTLSHEILELIANPHVNLSVEARNPDPNVPAEKKQWVFVRREVCDPVLNSSY